MARNVDELLSLLRLDRRGPERFRGGAPPATTGRNFGGLVAAQALLAAGTSVPIDRRPCSLHAYFLAGGQPPTAIDYTVEHTRDGGSISTRRVTASQGGSAIFDMASLFKISEQGLDHQDLPPEAPDPAHLIRSERLPNGSDATEFGAVDIRIVGAWSRDQCPSRMATHSANQRVWFRVDGRLPDDHLLHAAALVFASDLTLLPVVVLPHRVQGALPDIGLRASLDHAIWFHRPFRADQWLLYDQVTTCASDGRGLAAARIYTSAGQLVASVNQEALIRQPMARLSQRPGQWATPVSAASREET